MNAWEEARLRDLNRAGLLTDEQLRAGVGSGKSDPAAYRGSLKHG